MIDFVIEQAAMSKAQDTQHVLITIGDLDVNREIEGFGNFLVLATKRDKLNTAHFFLEHGANLNLSIVQDSVRSLAVAADKVLVNVAACSTKYRARVNDSGAIVLAAENRRMDMVKLLLKHGADIDEIGLKNEDERNDVDMGSPQHKAISRHEVEMVKFLLEHGADAEKCDFLGRTALQWANELGHKEEAAVLNSHSTNKRIKQNTKLQIARCIVT